MINVEVAYALPEQQKIISLQVEEGCSAYDAVVQSGIVNIYPQIDIEHDPMGIFGKAIADPKKHVLKAAQRVEIYRPLIADPKEVRARRAAKAKAEREAQH
ncbi:RnfH family protein [Amphritea sp. 1_MG-2023]|uniref:RnfH family protein n=1 Tax=Amphritea sp. 1_MG-2023 TaxID=3062670 RepID=UPI0026E3F7B5|nr:RnfH family protein [Amphritea sp. 1_MG-2023]MDO6563225.1 RnfH family protein [Amphritea sp. 1_MG-2023]